MGVSRYEILADLEDQEINGSKVRDEETLMCEIRESLIHVNSRNKSTRKKTELTSAGLDGGNGVQLGLNIIGTSSKGSKIDGPSNFNEKAQNDVLQTNEKAKNDIS